MARRLFLPFLRCLHTRKEKISNIDDEISAWLGREQAKSKGHSGGVSARVAFETNCRIDPVPLVATLTNKDASRFPDQATASCGTPRSCADIRQPNRRPTAAVYVCCGCASYDLRA